MSADLYSLQVLLVTLAGWGNRHQQHVIAYQAEENRALKEQVKGRRLRLIDDQRRRLAAKGRRLGRRVLAWLRARGRISKGIRTRVQSPPRAFATTTGTCPLLSQHRDPRDQKPPGLSIPGSAWVRRSPVAGSNRGLDMQNATRPRRRTGLT